MAKNLNEKRRGFLKGFVHKINIILYVICFLFEQQLLSLISLVTVASNARVICPTFQCVCYIHTDPCPYKAKIIFATSRII